MHSIPVGDPLFIVALGEHFLLFSNGLFVYVPVHDVETVLSHIMLFTSY